MTSFIEDILRGRAACAVAADLRRRSGTAQLNHLVATLAAHGVELELRLPVRAARDRAGRLARGAGAGDAQGRAEDPAVDRLADDPAVA